MMDTVPKEVVLSDPLVPLKWKLKEHQLQISADGVVSIAGVFRVNFLLSTYNYSY
jgi:hypothetical protein